MALVLASASLARRRLLAQAGLDFEVVPAAIDERAVEAPIAESGATADDIALALAMVKATSVSEERPGDLVIGCDQTLEANGERYSKPADMEAARRQLLALEGRRHALHAAVVLAEGGSVVWSHVETAILTMRKLTPAEIGRYLARAGQAALASVGAYQIEGLGVTLFEEIEGDFFAIQGLPLLPLLAELRERGAVPDI